MFWLRLRTVVEPIFAAGLRSFYFVRISFAYN
jgi:hypothetical protein